MHKAISQRRQILQTKTRHYCDEPILLPRSFMRHLPQYRSPPPSEHTARRPVRLSAGRWPRSAAGETSDRAACYSQGERPPCRKGIWSTSRAMPSVLSRSYLLIYYPGLESRKVLAEVFRVMLMGLGEVIRNCFQAEEDGMRCPRDGGLLCRIFGRKNSAIRSLHKL